MTHAWTGADTAPVLSVRNLSVQYRGSSRPTIDGISFELRRGQVMLVTGGSGSGKSTLTLALAGVIPTSIEADVSGVIDVHPDLLEPGKIGYVFQDPETQFCMYQVADELAFGLENIRMPRERMNSAIDRALEQVGLNARRTASHAHFSGGMKQKLAIASALALDAELFIFDEPTANLDPLSTRQVYETILALRDLGKTILIIEHKYAPLLPFVDNVLQLPSRRVAGEGDTTYLGQSEAYVATTKWNFGMARENKVLQLRDVDLKFDKTSVWRDVSFDVHTGEWIAILGPNGSGKSSLLEVMAGLTSPSSGSVLLNGKPIGNIARKRRYQTIAYGFQNPEYQFLFERTCDEIAGRVLGDERPAKVLNTLQEYGLLECAELSPYQLSQGQKRRLAIAIMMLGNHDVYLFDEPTYGQDAQSEQWILRKLKALQAEGKTIITVTHDVKMVREYASRALVLSQGKMTYDGSVAELFTRETILEEAHLLDDVKPLLHRERKRMSLCEQHDASSFFKVSSPSLERVKRTGRPIERRSPMGRFHPGLKLITLLVIATLTMFVNDFSHLAYMWGWLLFIAFPMAWVRPYPMMKRLAVLIVFYIMYLWTFSANAAVPTGTREIHWLWFHISMYGFWQGVLVSLRTFATVLYAYVFLVTTDMTDFLVSLSQTFRVAPKLSYALLAGTSFIPQIERDIRNLRKAKAVRARFGHLFIRPATYALPLLSQAIRHSERMAIAMETRGFRGEAADNYNGRTYYRRVPVWILDAVMMLVALFVTITLFVLR